MTKQKLYGEKGEAIALDYLQKKGLELVQRNFFSRFGEIDLIMKDQDVLIFVEVKMRHATKFANALESVTNSKINKIIKTADIYMQKTSYTGNCRIDVIGIDANNNSMTIEWIKNITI